MHTHTRVPDTQWITEQPAKKNEIPEGTIAQQWKQDSDQEGLATHKHTYPVKNAHERKANIAANGEENCYK